MAEEELFPEAGATALNWTLGASWVSLSEESICRSASALPPNAAIEIGTFWMLSSRRRAVTTMSEIPAGPGAAAVCTGASFGPGTASPEVWAAAASQTPSAAISDSADIDE